MRKRTKRFLATLLAAAMVLQQGSALGVLAGETEPASETRIETESETNAPKTTVETSEDETKNPETQAETTPVATEPTATPDAEADVEPTATPDAEPTATPDAEAGAEPTATPDAEPKATPSVEPTAEPSTEPVTEPATVSETKETETEIETEPATEAEAETEMLTEAAPTLLEAECEGVTVKVEAAEGVLKAGTVLKMEKAAGKRVALEAIQGTLDENTEVNKKKFLAYDITLMLDGQEVQPDGEVTVSFSGVPFEAEENEELIVAHLNEEEASPIGTISTFSATSGASNVEVEKGLSIRTTHFSVYAVAVLKKLNKELSDKGDNSNKYAKYENLKEIEEGYQSTNEYSFSYVEDGIDKYFSSNAFDFHIFAEDVEINAHTNGNIAAERLTVNGANFGTNQNKADNITEYNYIGESVVGLGELMEGSVLVLGKDIPVELGNNNEGVRVGQNYVYEVVTKDENGRPLVDDKGNPRTEYRKVVDENGNPVLCNDAELSTLQQGTKAENIYQEGETSDKYIDIEEELNNLKEFSKALAKIGDSVPEESKTAKILSEKQNEKNVIEVTGTQDINYINITAEKLMEGGGWLIKGIQNKTLIINVDMTGVKDPNFLSKLDAVIDGVEHTGEEVVRENCNLLWNFYTKENGVYAPYNGEAYVAAEGLQFHGTLLAPDADIHYGAINGSIIAKKAHQNGKESHKWTFTGGSVAIKVNKEVLNVPDDETHTFYFAVYDEAGTLVMGPKSLTFTGSGTKSLSFNSLKPGTYKVYETDEDGNKLEDGTKFEEFTVSGSGKQVDLEGEGNKKKPGEVDITNTKPEVFTGNLSVSKTVSGNACDKNKEFHFTVELSDKTVNGTYGDMTFTDGVASVTLKDGQSAKATELPSDITYTVTETEANQDGYETTSENPSGTIPKGGTARAKFVNNKDEFGGLIVSKTVKGNAGDKNKEFHFTVELSDKTVNGTYGDMTFTDGVASVTLKDGQSAEAKKLPASITYTVEEEEANQDGYVTTPENASGTIPVDDTAKAAFVNEKNEYSELTVKKTVSGNAGETEREFHFTVTLSDKTVNGKHGDMTFTDGVAELTLKHGESAKATELPAGITYTVEEREANQEGYTTTAENASGKLEANDTKTATFKNAKSRLGGLIVKKTVSGNSGDKNKEFHFTVTLSDKSINGNHGDMEFRDGVAKFTLKHGQSAEATELPADITYTVKEEEANQDDYVTEYNGVIAKEGTSGTTTSGKMDIVEVTNTKNLYGDLSVTKIVEGSADDQKEFTFTVTLDDKSVNGVKGDMTFTDGVATFTLKHGETKTARNLPVNTRYTVKETTADGYVLTEYTGDTGTIRAKAAEGEPDTTAKAEFTNTKVKGKIMLIKLGANNLALQGAEFDLYRVKKEGETDDVKINPDPLVTDSQGRIIFQDLEPGTYYFVETKAPKGYVTPEGDAAKTETRVVEPDKVEQKTLTVYMRNTEELKGKLTLTKMDKADGKKLLAGAEFDLRRVKTDGETDDVTVETGLVTDENGQIVVEDLEPGTYYFVETKAPAGYVTPEGEAAKTKEATVLAGQSKLQELTVTQTNTKEEKGKIKLTKTDADTKKALSGAEFQLYKAGAGEDGGDLALDKYTTGEDGTFTTEELEPGTYYFVETKAPAGYVMPTGAAAKTEEATVLAGQSTLQELSVSMENEKTSVKVSKVDVATGAELEGAHIQILDKDGNVVEEWDSTKEAHEVKGLKTGETYTLKETVAPDGYTLTAETTFTLNEDGTVDSGKTTTNTKDGVLLVEDSFNKISILKVDESGEALKGAKLVIKDAEGAIVGEPWKSGSKAHDITGLAKGSYTLSEIEAPKGYQVSADVPFEITGKEAAGQTIEVKMTDEKIPESATYSLTVTKNLRLEGITSDIGIRDAVFYVALFSDEAKTQRVSSVKQIVFKNQISSSVTFDNLSAGTYYVGETDENGTLLVSKMVNDRIIFYPEYTGEGKVLLEGDEKNAIADFTNVYVEFTDDLYLSGQLKITKKILINGEEGTSDATYYAGVFNSPDMSEPLEIVPLELGGGSSTSYTVTNLPIGNTIGSSMTYYVTETDENGVPLDPEEVTEFEVSVDKSEIILDANNSRQEVVITNSFTEKETETEVPKKEAPKTGDDTNFMRYLLMMALSAGVCAVAFEEKRRKARRVRK